MKHFDSILFDMDGTLWDAVDSYCAVWNRTISQLGVDAEAVDRQKLQKLMGMQLSDIYNRLIGDRADRATFTAALSANEAEMMPQLGGRLYPGVRSTLEKLSGTHKLFMVSNCDASGLPNFYHFTGLGPLFTDGLSFGMTKQGKSANIHVLVSLYNLEHPLYVGDVRQDCLDAHAAGVPFVWASYGFGTDVAEADYRLRTIEDLLTICKH